MSQNIVILVRQEGLGEISSEDRGFRIDMFDRFLHALESQAVKPQTICFYTDGVKLVRKSSRAVPGLRLIEGMGVRLLSCKSCLDYFQIALDDVAVGQISTMNEIVGALISADKVITI